MEFRQVTLCSNHIKNTQQACLANPLEKILLQINKEFKKTMAATGTSLNKRFNEQNNGFARAL